jgi:ribonuclease Z
MHERHPTCQVITAGDELFLVDCGEGAQAQMNRYKIRRSRINHIFISHLHGDHYFGLPGLLNSFSLTSRKEPVHLHAPAPLKAILDLQFEAAQAHLTYPLHFHALEEEREIVSLQKFSVMSFRVSHRIECWGFLFREKEKPRKIDPDRAIDFDIPSSFYAQLKEGLDYHHPSGRLVKNEWVTRSAVPPRSYAFCADTRFDPRIAPIVQGCNLLYHEATYLDDLREKAEDRYHSTARQAAELALLAGVGNLLIGHFSSKYEDLAPFLSEASATFPKTQLAQEGVSYLVLE